MQALIITAYKNKELLEKNIRLFSSHFKCFVHIDKKSELNDFEYIQRLNSIENTVVISKYKINWGSYLHMMAILDLLKLAACDEEISRVHIISGEDFPLKTVDEFDEFFERDNRYRNFINIVDIRDDVKMKRRYEKFHFCHILNRKSNNILIKFLDKGIRQFQYHIPLKRNVKFDYMGLVWSSLSIEGVRAVIEYMTPLRIKILKYCAIAEEFMIQNALMDSDLKDTVVPDSKSYNVWERQDSSGPRVLTIDDYENMIKSNCFFARKIQDSGDDKGKALYDALYNRFC